MFQPDIDTDIVHWLSWTARGFLSPLAAAVGGVASQEVLKAVTGKFSPLCQWVSSVLLFICINQQQNVCRYYIVLFIVVIVLGKPSQNILCIRKI